MESVNHKVEHLKVKAEVLQYALTNAGVYEDLMSKFEPNTANYKAYSATMHAWRRVAADLAEEF